MSDTKNAVKEALLELLSGGVKEKKSKTSPKYVLVVNDRVCQNRPTKKSEVKKAVIALSLKNPSAKVEVYKFEAVATVDLPVGGFDAAVDTGAE